MQYLKSRLQNTMAILIREDPLPFYNQSWFTSYWIVVAFSGFLIQFSYHIGHHGVIDINKMVYNISYSDWTTIHKISIILMSVLVACHINQHWKWYRTVVAKSLIAKNKQVITLSVLFFIVALTGYLSWFIDLTGNDPIARKIFLEIHDKIAIAFFIFLLLHVVKRLKWFANKQS